MTEVPDGITSLDMGDLHLIMNVSTAVGYIGVACTAGCELEHGDGVPMFKKPMIIIELFTTTPKTLSDEEAKTTFTMTPKEAADFALMLAGAACTAFSMPPLEH